MYKDCDNIQRRNMVTNGQPPQPVRILFHKIWHNSFELSHNLTIEITESLGISVGCFSKVSTSTDGVRGDSCSSG